MQDALERRGGTLLAISADSPPELAELARAQDLRFPLLSDPDRQVIRAYGLLHTGGGPGGGDIAIPAQVLVRSDGSVAWRHVSGTITDRMDPADTLAALSALLPGSG